MAGITGYAGNHPGMPCTTGQSRLGQERQKLCEATCVTTCAEAHRQLALVDESQCRRYEAQIPPGEGANQRSRDCIQNLKEGKQNLKEGKQNLKDATRTQYRRELEPKRAIQNLKNASKT